MPWIEDVISTWHFAAYRQSPHCNLLCNLGLSRELLLRYIDKPPRYLIGADEVGLGALAGPVTCGVVMAPLNWDFKGVNDSKKFSKQPSKREAIANQLRQAGVRFRVCSTPSELVDKWSMPKALRLTYEECLTQLQADYEEDFADSVVIIDGEVRLESMDHMSLPKGDSIVPHISAASILAKTMRDEWMSTVAQTQYPSYGFAKHKGYGSAEHYAAIKKLGPSPLHRRSYDLHLEDESHGSDGLSCD